MQDGVSPASLAVALSVILACSPQAVSAGNIRRVGAPKTSVDGASSLPAIPPLATPLAGASSDIIIPEAKPVSPALSPPRASSPAIPESLTVPDKSALGRLQDVVAGRTSASELLDTSPDHAPLAVDPTAHPDTAQALLHEVNDFLAAAGVKARLSLLTETMSGAASAPNLLSAVLLNADAESDRFAQIGRAYALLQSGRERFPWMPEAIELLWPEKNGRMSRYRNGIPSPGVALALGESRYVLALLTQSRAPIPAYMPFTGQAPFPGALYYYFDKDPVLNADRLMAEDRDGWVVYRLSPRVEPGESLLWHDYYLLWTSREPGK